MPRRRKQRRPPVPSRSFAEEWEPIITTKKRRRRRRLTTTTETLTSPPLPTLSSDIVAEILCRLPVQHLLKLRCICKSWKALISDNKFIEKHLIMSKASRDRHHLTIYPRIDSHDLELWDSIIPTVFSSTMSSSTVKQTRLWCPNVFNNFVYLCSCDGILCFTIMYRSVLLWNPSIRRFYIYPPLPIKDERRESVYSFGYDHFTQSYKIVAVTNFRAKRKNEVRVYTLGMDSWRRIKDLPYSDFIIRPGVFVSGTITWLVYDATITSKHFIISLDFENESYQKLLLPNVETDTCMLGVLRDFLCISASTDMFVDVWIMKEFGNKESWTKLYQVPYCTGVRGLYPRHKALYISNDDQLLMIFRDSRQSKLGVYDFKSGTFNMSKLESFNSDYMDPEVYVESLISPCS
ncbi:F-box/kelch-repeat protein [Trifolium pratense]|uniref:F-box/kelch-repeat protein n=1 Tax=Trifolium pratense TaxID=57577 RepID=A0A2K3NF10_TRIPR|nr:F-box/kelch-repeat protein [Trifolium pratense]